MTSKAISGVGTIIQQWNSSTSAWETIAEVNNISGPSITKDLIEVTSLDSIDGYKEYIGGFRDAGNVVLSMNYTRAGLDSFMDNFEGDAATSYEIILPDAESTTLAFEGFVQEFPLTIPADSQITMEVTLKITGKVEILTSISTPVITLVGDATLNYVAGDTYVEYGATATDAIDGDLTESIVISGSLDMSVIGTYTKYYDVTNSIGTAAVTETRTIIVAAVSITLTMVQVFNTVDGAAAPRTPYVWFTPSVAYAYTSEDFIIKKAGVLVTTRAAGIYNVSDYVIFIYDAFAIEEYTIELAAPLVIDGTTYALEETTFTPAVKEYNITIVNVTSTSVEFQLTEAILGIYPLPDPQSDVDSMTESQFVIKNPSGDVVATSSLNGHGYGEYELFVTSWLVVGTYTIEVLNPTITESLQMYANPITFEVV